MTFAYLDTSAFVKTVIREAESERLESWLRTHPDRASCALIRTEAIRAVRPSGTAAVERARRALERLRLVRLEDDLLDAAADLPGSVRTLAAIHLAAAQALGVDLGVVVTYDERMAQAADGLGMAVVSP
jgi:predicted nucleic acid-binding protein